MTRKTTQVAAAFTRPMRPPSGTRAGPAVRRPPDMPSLSGRESRYPHILRLPADWWDSPSAVCCPLDCGPRSARTARQLTRKTLGDWGRNSLIGDAEAIVAELVANAVTHGAKSTGACDQAASGTSLRWLRGTSEVLCAVLDASDAVPMLKPPATPDEAGRGLWIVDALSDAWGWSPLAGRGKAVWAVLF